MLFAAVVLAGCGNNQTASTPATNSTASSVSGNPLNAPAEYGNALANAQNRAVKTIDVAALNQAVQMYYAQEGKFPKDLNDLVKEKLIDHIPNAPRGMKIVYDAAAGQVNVVNE